MSLYFRDKVVFIVGASSGIGHALAAEFARQAAHVVLMARDIARLQTVEHELDSLPGSRLVVPADIRDPRQIHEAIAMVRAHFDRIDVLVNSAGIGMASPTAEMDLQDLRDTFDTNFFGNFSVLRAVLPHMIERRSGFIIQLSSPNGFCAVPLGSAYVSSKFALEGLTRTIRAEVRPYNVDILIVRPGLTKTDFFDKAKHFRASDPFPMHFMMSPEYVAREIVRAAARGRSELVLGIEGKSLWWLNKFSPRLADSVIATIAARYRAKKAAERTKFLSRS